MVLDVGELPGTGSGKGPGTFPPAASPLDLAQVHAALSYYFTHRTEIQAEIRENAEQAEKWRQTLSPKAS